MAKNRVEKFFVSLAMLVGIEEKHGWRTKLVNKLGKKIGIDEVGQIYVWTKRDRLPKDWVDNFEKLSFPENIIKQCQICKEIPLRSENHSPVSNNSVHYVEEPSPIYNTAMTELFSLIENPEMASKLAQSLVCVLKRDPERFYNEYYSEIIDDCYMLKRIITKNRRKKLRILN